MTDEKKGAKAPSGPSVLKRTFRVGGWWPAQIVKSVTGMILDDPEGPLDFLWRIFSITSVTSILVFGLLIWKNPTLDGLFNHTTESIAAEVEKDKELGEELIGLMGDFFSFYKPAHLALVDWTKGTGVELVWSNIPGANFPTPVSGIIGLNMKPAVAEMVYGECWMGQLGQPKPGETPFWISCPINGPHGVQGFVLMSWNVPPCNTKSAATKLLAHRISALVF